MFRVWHVLGLLGLCRRQYAHHHAESDLFACSNSKRNHHAGAGDACARDSCSGIAAEQHSRAHAELSEHAERTRGAQGVSEPEHRHGTARVGADDNLDSWRRAA